MEVTEKGLAVIRAFEGRALTAYRDSAGVWTIGFGITNFDKWAVQYLGRPIGAGMTITEEQAEYLLRESLARSYVPATAKAMPNASPQALDGGVSFHYNTGAIGRASWVKIWRSGSTNFLSSILSWNKAGGKVLAGLTRRRQREYEIITKGDYGPEGRTAPPTLNAAGRVVAASEKEHHLSGTPGMLKIGDQGPEVADLNRVLAALGFATSKSADVFDSLTDAAVRSFQTAHKQLRVDGIAGPATRAAINREVDAKAKIGGLVKTTTVATAATGGVDLSGLAHVPFGVYLTIGLVAVIVLGVIAYHYRDELNAMGAR